MLARYVRIDVAERRLSLRHSVGELAQLANNKTNKSIVNPREALDDNLATVRATIAAGNDKPPAILPS